MSTPPDLIRTAHVEENGKSTFAVTIQVSGYELQGDEPKNAGGGDRGPNPYDMLLASLGECTAMTVRWYAQQKNWPVEKVEVTLTHAKLKADQVPEAVGKTGMFDVFEKKIVIHGTALTDEQRTKLLEVAAKCPVQRTLQSDVIIRTTA